MELPVIPAYVIAIMALNSAGLALCKWVIDHWTPFFAYFFSKVLPPLYVSGMYLFLNALNTAPSPVTPFARLGFFMIFLPDTVESLHRVGRFILRKVKMLCITQ